MVITMNSHFSPTDFCSKHPLLNFLLFLDKITFLSFICWTCLWLLPQLTCSKVQFLCYAWINPFAVKITGCFIFKVKTTDPIAKSNRHVQAFLAFFVLSAALSSAENNPLETLSSFYVFLLSLLPLLLPLLNTVCWILPHPHATSLPWGTSSTSMTSITPRHAAHCLSHVQLFVTPWTIAHQARLSMGFSRQEHWSGLPCPPPGDLPDPRIKPGSSSLQVDSLPLAPPPGLHTPFTPNLHIQLSTVTSLFDPNHPEWAPFHASNLPLLCILIMPKKNQYNTQARSLRLSSSFFFSYKPRHQSESVTVHCVFHISTTPTPHHASWSVNSDPHLPGLWL